MVDDFFHNLYFAVYNAIYTFTASIICILTWRLNSALTLEQTSKINILLHHLVVALQSNFFLSEDRMKDLIEKRVGSRPI